jgi:hypothetical protein
MFGKYNGFVSKARVSACMYFLVNISFRTTETSTDKDTDTDNSNNNENDLMELDLQHSIHSSDSQTATI